MNANLFGKISAPEISLLIVFIVYIIFPISTPEFMIPLVDSPIGYISIFIITVGLFVYTSPILGILYIFVAYELLRRSSARSLPVQTHQYSANDRYSTQYMPTHVPKSIPELADKQDEMARMNPVSQPTLEEEIIQIRAPVGTSTPSSYTESSFKPVADSIIGASLYQ
jgi:hypothetical protein